MKSTLDWDNLEGSLEALLGSHRRGWIDFLLPEFDDIRSRARALGDYPEISNIFEKFGKLSVYVGHPVSDGDRAMLDKLVCMSEFLCECCGNSARTQDISGYLVTLCNSCYHAQYKDKSVPQISRGVDVARRYPALVSDNVASLVPSVGQGWMPLINRGVNKMHGLLRRHEGELQIEISDIREKLGTLKISMARSHPITEEVVDQMVREADLTCVECSYFGQRVRGKREHMGMCPVCDEG
ncbi:hypothetical protein FEE96_18985 [Parasedimentitalea maritima]|uniref:Uncharacterized protein n=1 Tax=Parasedimentitalea maritima TaxID=2578117 RepID=A0ABY2UR56_9RHOB|nr:hypothetical protein [Zongyanglinia marina]TLP58517.1 hypothetical protein FEE96_18985 [Zongyanglinia marina]